MVATVASVREAAAELLAAAEAALATTTRGAVALSWLNPGLPAFDCGRDFVCVWESGAAFVASAVIPTSQQFRTGPRVTVVTLNVTTGRCLHVGTTARPPSEAEKTADADVHMEDGQALWNNVGAAIAAGELFDGTCKQVSLQGMTAYTPQGGLGGWNLVVSAQIDGYPV